MGKKKNNVFTSSFDTPTSSPQLRPQILYNALNSPISGTRVLTQGTPIRSWGLGAKLSYVILFIIIALQLSGL